MVFNKSVFRKLIKSAYKTCGLLVANMDDRIVLAGGWWMMSAKERYVPNWALAAVIELTGEIPAAGESFRAEPGGNQMEFPNEFIKNLDGGRTRREKADRLVDTHILVDRIGGLQHYLREGNKVVAVNEMMMELYDPDAGENREPCDITISCLEQKWVYWHTPACSWACGIIDHQEAETITFDEKLGEMLEQIQG